MKQQLARDHVLVDKSVVERYKEKFTTNPEMAEVMAVLDQGDRRYNFYRCYECKNPYFGGRWIFSCTWLVEVSVLELIVLVFQA